ncbi:PepSY-associated TM helix domain-containing protein [Sphaerotilus sp.]|uniref:PepSY-associated TM helix domain-containing protein n=1 Tax=Sphaerotilus sp. TaxID=2093942 RepID=UPI002ACEA6DE|nr:PepSY-associated TM helix domain-containing protein [Sphaerotilus sp.]MDZ7855878.1 PepSY-associated TM helix domain-containing protein [Sphaerotilus sp.]
MAPVAAPSATPAATAVTRPRAPRVWRQLHRWLAYVFGALFVLQGLSGSLLVVSGPLDAWLNPDMAVPAAQRSSLAAMAERLERQHPGAVGLGVKQGDDAGQLIMGFWPEPDPLIPIERRWRLARLHPGSGDAVAVQAFGDWPRTRYDALGFLYAVHSNLTLGAVGRLIQIGAAMALLVLLAAGIANWVNRRRALHGKPAHLVFDSAAARWHRGVGLASAFVLAVLLTSGLALQFETVLDPSFSYRSEDGAEGQPRLPLQAAWVAAERQYPGAQARLIMAPFTEGGTFRVDLVPASGPHAGQTVELFVDAHSGRVLRVRDEGGRQGIDRFVALLEPVHGGGILGLPGEALALLSGLVPLLMLWTGLRRRRRKVQVP